MTSRHYFSVFLGILFCVIFSNGAYAAAGSDDISSIAGNISDSASELPGLIAAFAYLSGLLMATSAVFKTVDHVSNPAQTPIRVPTIRFLIGGALFALPMLTEAIITTVTGNAAAFNLHNAAITFDAGLFGITGSTAGNTNFNAILQNFVISGELLPGLVATVAYLLALVLTVSALYKTRDHVEDPERSPLKDAVVRYLTAGALFALPTMFDAMFETIDGGGLGFGGSLISILSGAWFDSTQGGGTSGCTSTGGGTAGQMSEVICHVMSSTMSMPRFLGAISYFIGLVLGLWAILKIRDHVNNPAQVALSEGVSRLIAAGAFFAMPVVAMALAYSVTPDTVANQGTSQANTSFNTPIPLSCGTANALDQAMACFMDDILSPSHVLLNFFCLCAGMIFIMIGISRLTKTAQEGARGPGGIGTISTFVIGAILISATTILRAISSSLFTGGGNGETFTRATLAYTGGMSPGEIAAAYNVVNAVLKFMIVIGMISFVRGLFIMRDVSEGQQGASTMAGMTHIIGGALAVNLGPLLNAIQATLGVTAFGVTFN
ncbi:MAG: hypothetical protein ACRBB3_06845 [Alphaproteobacteria bacterium]